MIDINIHCLQCLSHIPLNRRIIPGAIFLTAVIPFLILNYFSYMGSDHDDSTAHINRIDFYLQSRPGKVSRRFFQQMRRWNRSIALELGQEAENGSRHNANAPEFYLAEQLLAKQLEAENIQYEESCAKVLNNTSNTTDLASQVHKLPQWQEKFTKCRNVVKTKFFLTAALQVRIYKSDKAKWTIKELKQWLHYMFWAGIEHVYVCDHYHFTSEKLDWLLRQYIDAKLVTYLSWNAIRIPMTAQVACYQYIIDKFGYDSVWQIAVDIDEYPFMPNDNAENFLARYLKAVSFSITEISLHNFLMLGHGDRSRTMAIERITRMTPEPANELDKPMYRPHRVIASIHHNQVKHGRRAEALDEEIRLLHYWGSRISHFGPDTPDLMLKTVKYTALRDSIASFIRHSLISFGELDAFSNNTGP